MYQPFPHLTPKGKLYDLPPLSANETNNKPAEKCTDSPRYKAIGNSMAVPVIGWIGKQTVNYIKGE